MVDALIDRLIIYPIKVSFLATTQNCRVGS